MSRPVKASSPAWKVASVPASVEGKLLKLLDVLKEYAPMRGTTRLDPEVKAAWANFEESIKALGFIVQTKEKDPAWYFLSLPLLAAMERGIEDHLEDYARRYLESLKVVETESAFRVWGQETATKLEHYIESTTDQRSVKVQVDADEDDIYLSVANFPEQSDGWWVDTERFLNNLVYPFAQKFDLEPQIYGVDYPDGAFQYHVRFSPS